ncbi:MAG: hypothetical protein WCP89_00385 [archaeon]
MSDRIYLRGEEIWEEYTEHDTPVPGCWETGYRRRIDLENQRTSAIHYGQFAQKQIEQEQERQRRRDIEIYGDR